MHRESMIYRQIGHFLMPSSGNLVTKNKQLSRAVDLLSQASEEIDRLTAKLAEAKKALRDTTWQDHADSWQKRALKAERELAEARKDTGRLNWLDHYPAIIRYAAIVGSKVRPIIDRHMYECMSDAERAAIDAEKGE
jgi:hypothetical protein